MRLRILGDLSAAIEERTLGPDATHVFAALLVIALSPQNHVSRRRLATLLWPEAPSARQAERLRWLLSKLRSCGVPIDVTPGEIALDPSSLETDYGTLLGELGRDDTDPRSSAIDRIGAVMPDYSPDFSAPLQRWVEEQRETITDELLTQLIPRLADARRRGSWTQVEPLARAVRRLSPLHEEGTLSLAEALCARGDKSRAIDLLDEYLAAIGDDRGELRLPAELLHRRMRAPNPATAHAAPHPTTFVGRREALQRYEQMIAEANGGRGFALLLSGPAGIGKTRLLDEMATLAFTLARAAVVRTRYHASDTVRPLAGILDLIPKLLELPGAAGSDPETVRRLSQLASFEEAATENSALPQNAAVAPHVRHWLPRALCDLVAAISHEQALIVQLDDLQWSDDSQSWLWSALLPFTATHRVGWCFSVRSDNAETARQSFPADVQRLIHTEWLSGLTRDDAGILLDSALSSGQRRVSNEVRETLLEKGGGIPLVLEELARHWLTSGDLASVPRTLAALMEARLGRLTATARRALQVSAMLGTQSTLGRLERVLQLPRPEFVEALAQLESAGIMTTDAVGTTHGHVLWAEAATAQLEPSVARVLHRHIAECLDAEMASAPSVSVLWEAARHWGLAGQAQQQLAAITTGSEHLVRNCLYVEAAQAYGRALQESMDALQQRRFLRRRIELFRLAGDFRSMLGDIERHEELSIALDPLYDRHNELEMLQHTAHYILHDLPTERVAEESLACAKDPSASPSHRLHAAFNCIRYAEQGDLEGIMADAHRIAMSVVPTTLEDVRHQSLGDIIYNESVGDVRRAVAVAKEWAAAEEKRGDPYWITWSARKLALTLLIAGEIDDARRSALEAIRVAREARLHGVMGSGYEVLLCLSWDHDEPAETRKLLDLAERDCAGHDSEMIIHAILLPLRKAQVAIEEGHPEAARRLLPPRPTMLKYGLSGRVDSAAVLLAADLLEDRDAASVHKLAEELAEAFVRPFWGQGWNAAVYARYLTKHRSRDSASAFVSEYVQNLRRELGPMSRHLAEFMAAHQTTLPAAYSKAG